MVEAEDAGQRVVAFERRVFSKAKGDMVTKKVKSPIEHVWKKTISDAVMENKMLNLNVDVEINAEEEADLEIELDQDFLVQNIIDLEIEDFDDFGLGALEID